AHGMQQPFADFLLSVLERREALSQVKPTVTTLAMCNKTDGQACNLAQAPHAPLEFESFHCETSCQAASKIAHLCTSFNNAVHVEMVVRVISGTSIARIVKLALSGFHGYWSVHGEEMTSTSA